MKQLRKLAIFLALAGCVSSEYEGSGTASRNSAQSSRVNYGDFSYNPMEDGSRLAFFRKSRSQPNSYKLILNDPFSGEDGVPVHQFTITPGICGNERDRGDCNDDPSGRGLKSLRSELSENSHRGTRYQGKQPKVASYEWEVGIPDGFPVGPRQQSGYFLLGQWHNGRCPHMNIGNWVNDDDYGLHLRINRVIPGHKFGDCQPEVSLPIVDVRDIEGGWAAIRVDVRWSTGDDGYARVYLNDELRVDYSGRTLVPEYTDRNKFDFGIYLANTRNLDAVTGGTLYYRNVRRVVQ